MDTFVAVSALADAQSYAHSAFNMAHEQFLAGSVSNLGRSPDGLSRRPPP
jgi:hypothetical protein